jgi:hypothetical protein
LPTPLLLPTLAFILRASGELIRVIDCKLEVPQVPLCVRICFCEQGLCRLFTYGKVWWQTVQKGVNNLGGNVDTLLFPKDAVDFLPKIVDP